MKSTIISYSNGLRRSSTMLSSILFSDEIQTMLFVFFLHFSRSLALISEYQSLSANVLYISILLSQLLDTIPLSFHFKHTTTLNLLPLMFYINFSYDSIGEIYICILVIDSQRSPIDVGHGADLMTLPACHWRRICIPFHLLRKQLLCDPITEQWDKRTRPTTTMRAARHRSMKTERLNPISRRFVFIWFFVWMVIAEHNFSRRRMYFIRLSRALSLFLALLLPISLKNQWVGSFRLRQK